LYSTRLVGTSLGASLPAPGSGDAGATPASGPLGGEGSGPPRGALRQLVETWILVDFCEGGNLQVGQEVGRGFGLARTPALPRAAPPGPRFRRRPRPAPTPRRPAAARQDAVMERTLGPFFDETGRPKLVRARGGALARAAQSRPHCQKLESSLPPLSGRNPPP
jgi:hypothetical protein